jgi:hypothetical protein
MGRASSAARAFLRGGIGCIWAIALLSANAAPAAPPLVDKEIPSPVTTLTARDIERLPSTRDLKSILDLHNQLRTDVKAQPLHWNPVLADHALAYARDLADTGQMRHASRVGRQYERENLSLSPRGVTRPLDMARLWARERQYFRPGIFPNVCSGDWSQCGHYTQMIWPTTTDLGCGFYSGLRYDALVCRYSPPGNRDGSPVIAVLQPPPELTEESVITELRRSVSQCVGQTSIPVPGRTCATGCPGAVNKCNLSPPASAHGPLQRPPPPPPEVPPPPPPPP